MGTAQGGFLKGWNWGRFGWGLLAAAVVFLAVEGIWIEPNSVQVTPWTVEDRLYPPLKIAQLSDLHVMHFGRREREVVEILKRERPDVVVITGDSVGEGLHFDRVHEVLSAIHCPMEDHRSPDIPKLTIPLFEDLKKIFKTKTGQVFVFPASGTGGPPAGRGSPAAACRGAFPDPGLPALPGRLQLPGP